MMWKAFVLFVVSLYRSRGLIVQLTARDFKTRYLGSYLGLLWAFVQPVVTIAIFWFVFEVGFKSAPVGDFPFILWLICGMIPWFFFADTLSMASNSIVENSHLVKKVVFRVSMLPLIKLLSALLIHVFFVAMIFAFFSAYGYAPTWCSLQVFYYSVCLCVLLVGLSWLSAALMVFLKDLGQMIAIGLQFGFWLTPIFWSLEMIPEGYRFYLKLNPFFYIVQGYRDSFIHHVWFWQHPVYTVYYWAVTLVVFVSGALVFTRLRPHFADVL
ncbi:ABC transporter permease [uncultured Desulfuromonas sp.]|uniref:ABC transporter permease n=1 Tax=uncultured Desulfuromonas sp. TaxID=181013 RepID=UPI002AAA6277|nr:ABC transporter permease [uncultured Desulfuromonas sp.]